MSRTAQRRFGHVDDPDPGRRSPTRRMWMPVEGSAAVRAARATVPQLSGNATQRARPRMRNAAEKGGTERSAGAVGRIPSPGRTGGHPMRA
ncbi:hypothetical protein GCM10010399_85960 [Dactylosporangium fulvum]